MNDGVLWSNVFTLNNSMHSHALVLGEAIETDVWLWCELALLTRYLHDNMKRSSQYP